MHGRVLLTCSLFFSSLMSCSSPLCWDSSLWTLLSKRLKHRKRRVHSRVSRFNSTFSAANHGNHQKILPVWRFYGQSRRSSKPRRTFVLSARPLGSRLKVNWSFLAAATSRFWRLNSFCSLSSNHFFWLRLEKHFQQLRHLFFYDGTIKFFKLKLNFN